MIYCDISCPSGLGFFVYLSILVFYNAYMLFKGTLKITLTPAKTKINFGKKYRCNKQYNLLWIMDSV